VDIVYRVSVPTRRSSDLPSDARVTVCAIVSTMIVWSYAIVVFNAISQPPTVDVSFGLVTGPWNSTLNGTGMWESFTTCPCRAVRSEEHTSELQSRFDLVC